MKCIGNQVNLYFRIKDLESKLAERDAMIRVLQKHTYDKDVSSFPSMLGRSPHHTPHPSLHGNTDLGGVLGTSVSREELGNIQNLGLFFNLCQKRLQIYYFGLFSF